MTPEGKLESYLIKRVRETGGKIRKLKWISHNGAPDRIAWWPAYSGPSIVFPEVKAPGEKLSPAQQREHKKMRDDGLVVMVVDSRESIDTMIRLYRSDE